MKKITRPLLPALVFVLALTSCAKKELSAPQWVYEKDAITLRLKADPMLNLDNSKAHTLYACIYQLKDPNGFNQLSGDLDGLYKLLECSRFDPGVAASKRAIVNPGDDTTLMMDRAENAKYLAVVAGYYTIEKSGITRLIEFPVVVEEKGAFSKQRRLVPGPLDITLYLGPENIEKIEVQ